MKKTGKQARLWGKTHVERDSCVLGNADPNSVLPADFIIPYENNYSEPPPNLSISLLSLNLSAPIDSVNSTPTEETVFTPSSDATRGPELYTYPSSISFSIGSLGSEAKEYTFALTKDIHFVTAHPCHPSSHVKVLRSPSSPTIQQIDVDGTGVGGQCSKPATITGKTSQCDLVQPCRLTASRTPSTQILHIHGDSPFGAYRKARRLIERSPPQHLNCATTFSHPHHQHHPSCFGH